MKKSLSALCLVLLALGLLSSPAAAEESVAPAPRPEVLSASCSAAAVDAVASPIPLGPPERFDAAGCCPRTCKVNSDCDASCGAGLGQCRFLGTCCSFCLCSLGGSAILQTELSSPLQP